MRALPLVATPLLVVSSLSGVRADPCGMVPPIWAGTGPAIMRVGSGEIVFGAEDLEARLLELLEEVP